MNKFIFKIFIVICFCQGLMFYVGIPNIGYKATVIIGSSFFLFLTFITKRKLFEVDRVLVLFFIYLFVIVISAIVNNSELIDTISYTYYLFTGIIIYMYISKISFSDREILKTNKLFFGIFIFQIFASVIKLFVWGTSEAVVGTIHFSGGSLNTLIPLIGISMLISFYLIYEKKKIYLLLILGFLFMAWAGEKRGIYFYFIIVLAFTLFSHNFLINKVKASKIILFFVLFPVISLTIIYFGARYAPTLNPERKMGGSFDPEHIYNYAIGYSTSTDLQGYAIGRFSGISAVFNNISNSDVKTVLIGNGPSAVLGKTNLDGEQYKYGVASFLGVNGWSTALISLGFIGAILIILIFGKIGRFAYKFAKYEKDKYWKAIAFGLYVITFVFFLDYLTYTRSIYHSVPLNLLILYTYGALRRRNKIYKIV